MDGLCGGIALIAGTAFLLTLLPIPAEGPVLLQTQHLAIVPGAIAGFLIYNVHPASVVRGDAGSLFVVHTSLREGIARVLPQAGAVGKPVVAFHLEGAPEVIQDGVSGYLVPPLDVGVIAERTVGLLPRCRAPNQVRRSGPEVCRRAFQRRPHGRAHQRIVL